jgi:hypothetical protein
MELASMLPGFRFLFTAIILSMSVLIFGLGAAALLRSAHEEFANLPSRRSTPEPMFARLSDDTPTTLALLRVDTVAERPVESVPADVQLSAGQPLETIPAEAEKTAALTSVEPMRAEAAKPEEPAREASAETPAAPLPSPEPPAANAEVKIAAVSAPELDAATPATTSLQPSDIPPFEPSIATTLIATLGGPAVQIDQRTTTTEAKPDRRTVRNRAAERARERRRMAAVRRARLAREATLTLQQQQPNPFAFPLTPATR